MTVTQLHTKHVLIQGTTTMIDWQSTISKTDITVARGATLNYYLVQGLDNFQERDITISLQEHSSVKVHAISLGSKKNELELNLTIDHLEPSASSSTSLKGLFSDQSKGKMNGMIKIRKIAQLSNAQLDERILLISKKAAVDAVPNLEIEADDVTASHAATVSSVSPEEIFYLQSRGITEKDSYGHIIKAFLSSQFAHLPECTERDKLEASLNNHLESLSYESLS